MPQRKDRDRRRKKKREGRADADGYLSESTPSSAQKYFQAYVPNWGQDGAGSNLSSFLRLGNTSDDMPATQAQQTLLDVFVNGTGGFFDDPRMRYDPGATNTAALQTLPGVTGASPDGGLTVAQRQTESGNLVSKGGWADHSDGNRITTTQGDKVEVIRGNYQLVVLGRQDEVGNSAIFDVSGGLVQPNDATPSNTMRLEWVRNYDGTWRIVEECQKGDVHNVVHGDVYEEQYGQNITSITGSEQQTAVDFPEVYTSDVALADGTAQPKPLITENNDLFDPNSPAYLGTIEPRQNPTIVERTWAASISSYTGSSTTRIPTIHEETWAQAITEVTDCSGTIHSTTKAGAVVEISEVGSVNEVTTAGLMTGVTVAIGKAEVSVIPLQFELNIGAKAEISMGPKFEASMEDRTGFHLADEEMEGVKTRLAATETALAETKNELSMTKTRVGMSIMSLVEDDFSTGATQAFVFAEQLLGV